VQRLLREERLLAVLLPGHPLRGGDLRLLRGSGRVGGG
jgi:hypothetical protein